VRTGYVSYREFLCEWTARGCWLAGGAGTEIVEFMRDVKGKKGAWWRDVRECWFQRGAAVYWGWRPPACEELFDRNCRMREDFGLLNALINHVL
jgi:hypothetical protein